MLDKLLIMLVTTVPYASFHRVGRVLSFSPVVGIGTPPTPQPRASAPPPFGSGGRVTLAGERGGGESQFRRGDTYRGALVLCAPSFILNVELQYTVNLDLVSIKYVNTYWTFITVPRKNMILGSKCFHKRFYFFVVGKYNSWVSFI